MMHLKEARRYIFLALLLAFTTLGTSFGNGRVNRAPAAFDKLKALQGDWEGKDDHGMVANSTFKTIVSGTTVMETLKGTDMEEMVTFYTVDGDGIALVHYCPTNNQPRMRAVPSDDVDAKELAFSFQGAGNLPDLETGHQHKLVIEFHDNNHITERWTWRRNGKDTDMVYQLSRKD
jgi:hypothetical protein